jgi:hypothetical protein
MYARLTTIEGLPDRMDDATRHVQEQTLAQLRQMDGFEGFVALADRQSGKLLGLGLLGERRSPAGNRGSGLWRA